MHLDLRGGGAVARPGPGNPSPGRPSLALKPCAPPFFSGPESPAPGLLSSDQSRESHCFGLHFLCLQRKALSPKRPSRSSGRGSGSLSVPRRRAIASYPLHARAPEQPAGRSGREEREQPPRRGGHLPSLHPRLPPAPPLPPERAVRRRHRVAARESAAEHPATCLGRLVQSHPVPAPCTSSHPPGQSGRRRGGVPSLLSRGRGPGGACGRRLQTSPALSTGSRVRGSLGPASRFPGVLPGERIACRGSGSGFTLGSCRGRRYPGRPPGEGAHLDRVTGGGQPGPCPVHSLAGGASRWATRAPQVPGAPGPPVGLGEGGWLCPAQTLQTWEVSLRAPAGGRGRCSRSPPSPL